MKQPDINKIKKEVLSGKLLSDICREGRFDVNAIRRILKKEGVDYHQIVSERKAKRNAIEFERCLKLARNSGLIPSGTELIKIGIPKGRITLYVRKLKEMGFMQKFINESKLNNDELLEDLYKIYIKTGTLPENRHVNMYSRFSSTSFYNHFGNLTNAVNLMLERYPEAKKKSPASQ